MEAGWRSPRRSHPSGRRTVQVVWPCKKGRECVCSVGVVGRVVPDGWGHTGGAGFPANVWSAASLKFSAER